VSDRHLRLLRAVAKRRQTDADRHHVDGVPSPASAARGAELRRVATRTTARLRAAEARRRSASDG
jgi:hypothetical protein